MQLKSIVYNIKSGSNTVAWYSGELSEDYNTFRSSEAPLPEYYAILREIGRKIWNDYLQFSDNEVSFELKEKQMNSVAVVKMQWQHPSEIKDVQYYIKATLLYHQAAGKDILIRIPKISVLSHGGQGVKPEELHQQYAADAEMERLLEQMNDQGMRYAMGERAQTVLPGMEK